MLNLAILFSLVVLLNLGNSVESGVAVENKIDTRFSGGTTQPDNFDNFHLFSLFLRIIRKYYNLLLSIYSENKKVKVEIIYASRKDRCFELLKYFR